MTKFSPTMADPAGYLPPRPAPFQAPAGTLFPELRVEIADSLTNRGQGDLVPLVDQLTDDDIAEAFSATVDNIVALLHVTGTTR
jgi:hypothetical protein